MSAWKALPGSVVEADMTVTYERLLDTRMDMQGMQGEYRQVGGIRHDSSVLNNVDGRAGLEFHDIRHNLEQQVE